MTKYPIHRSVNRPISFKGLKGVYIILAGISLVGDLLFFVLLYCCGVHPGICVLIALGFGAGSLTLFRWCSQVYGPYGWEQRSRRRMIPKYWLIRNRKTLIKGR